MRHLYIIVAISVLFAMISCNSRSSTADAKEKSSTSEVIYGIDVSHHQGKINWEQVAKGETKFVYIKATEGATFVDPRCRENAKMALQNGLDVGAYHFFRMTSSPKDQFKNFSKVLDSIPFSLVPVLDVEKSDGKKNYEIRAAVDVFVKLVYEKYNIYPMIYGSPETYLYYCSEFVQKHCMFFIGDYHREPVLSKGKTYTIWQYSTQGRVPGVTHHVDVDMLHKDASLDDIRFTNPFRL